MIYPAKQFVFRPPRPISQARRVLLKPLASTSQPYPWTTSPHLLAQIIAGIRRVSDADIILLEGHPQAQSILPVFKALGYNFPRVLTLDVKDSRLVEIENPLAKAFALPNIWIPNVLLSCDYWISVAPFRVLGKEGRFTIPNLLGLLPTAKYSREELSAFGWDRVIADLYFTLPFDLGVIEAAQRLIENGGSPRVEEFGQVFMGEPFAVDEEASTTGGLHTPYLGLIRTAKAEFKP